MYWVHFHLALLYAASASAIVLVNPMAFSLYISLGCHLHTYYILYIPYFIQTHYSISVHRSYYKRNCRLFISYTLSIYRPLF